MVPYQYSIVFVTLFTIEDIPESLSWTSLKTTTLPSFTSFLRTQFTVLLRRDHPATVARCVSVSNTSFRIFFLMIWNPEVCNFLTIQPYDRLFLLSSSLPFFPLLNSLFVSCSYQTVSSSGRGLSIITHVYSSQPNVDPSGNCRHCCNTKTGRMNAILYVIWSQQISFY